jgi:hypothetical protein
MPRPHLTPGKDPVPIVQEDGWASGPVWTGAENLARTGVRSLDRPARRQLLYRLRYSAAQKTCYSTVFSTTKRPEIVGNGTKSLILILFLKF